MDKNVYDRRWPYPTSPVISTLIYLGSAMPAHMSFSTSVAGSASCSSPSFILFQTNTSSSMWLPMNGPIESWSSETGSNQPGLQMSVCNSNKLSSCTPFSGAVTNRTIFPSRDQLMAGTVTFQFSSKTCSIVLQVNFSMTEQPTSSQNGIAFDDYIFSINSAPMLDS